MLYRPRCSLDAFHKTICHEKQHDFYFQIVKPNIHLKTEAWGKIFEHITLYEFCFMHYLMVWT